MWPKMNLYTPDCTQLVLIFPHVHIAFVVVVVVVFVVIANNNKNQIASCLFATKVEGKEVAHNFASFAVGNPRITMKICTIC